VAFLNVQSGAT